MGAGSGQQFHGHDCQQYHLCALFVAADLEMVRWMVWAIHWERAIFEINVYICIQEYVLCIHVYIYVYVSIRDSFWLPTGVEIGPV